MQPTMDKRIATVIGAIALMMGSLAWLGSTAGERYKRMTYDQPQPPVLAEKVRSACTATLKSNKEFEQPLAIAFGSVKLDQGRIVWQSAYRAGNGKTQEFTGLYQDGNCTVLTPSEISQ